MAKSNINSKKGFTIIEVVLVLAIAGLIFLMVFVALPALQRSQRDTARRNDLARVDTSLVQYQTNTQGTNNGSNLPYASGTYFADSVFEGTAKTTKINNKDVSTGGPCNDRPTADSTGSNMSCIFLRDYLNAGTAGTSKKNEFQDPAGTYYGMDITKAGNTPLTYKDLQSNKSTDQDGTTMDYVIHIVTGARCEGETAVADTSRHFAVIYRLEGAGTYCIDDQ